MSKREDGRLDDELRPVVITRGFTQNPAGSVPIEFGQTKVMCTASVTEGVPRWRKGSARSGLAHRGIRYVAASHPYAFRPRVDEGRPSGARRKSAVDGAIAAACIDLSALGRTR